MTRVTALLCLLGCGQLLMHDTYAQDRIPIILDADTGNEVDDPYALARALIEPTWEILALNATHWQTSHWAEPKSMENSHRLNQVLLGHMGLDIRTKRGGIARMYDWGDQAQHSAAAYGIIEEAKKQENDQKLTVIALGALTNVASAIYIDPSIQGKVKLYWLGTNYDFETGVLGTTDFNSIMDTQALHYLLKSSVEMHIMPHSLALGMDFTYKEIEDQFRGIHPLGDFLVDRWYNHLDGLRKARWLWDLALIAAMVNPHWAEEVTIRTSKDYGNREIYFYNSIDASAMKQEFLTTMVDFMEKQSR